MGQNGTGRKQVIVRRGGRVIGVMRPVTAGELAREHCEATPGRAEELVRLYETAGSGVPLSSVIPDELLRPT